MKPMSALAGLLIGSLVLAACGDAPEHSNSAGPEIMLPSREPIRAIASNTETVVVAQSSSILEVDGDGNVSTLWTAEPDPPEVTVDDDGTVSTTFGADSNKPTDVGIADDGTVYFVSAGRIGMLAPGDDEPTPVPVELGSDGELDEIAVDGAGNLYLLVEVGFESKVLVRKAGTDTVTTLPFEDLSWFGRIAVSRGGDVYVANSPDSTDSVTRLGAGDTTPQSVVEPDDMKLGLIAVDPDGDLWSVDYGTHEADPRMTAVRLDDALQQTATLPLTVTRNGSHDLAVTDDTVYVTDDNLLYAFDRDGTETQTVYADQVAVPAALQSTATGVAFAGDSVVVADLGYDTAIYAGGATGGPEPGRLVTVSANQAAMTLDGTLPAAITSLAGDLVVAERTYGQDGGRVTRYAGGTGTPEVLPFQFGNGGVDHGHPYAIAATAAGDIAVCTSGSSGESVLLLKNGAATSTETQQQRCRDGIAYNDAGDLYQLGERVLAKLPGGESELVDVRIPGAINPVAVAIGPGDKIYLADNGDDTTGPRILVFADGDTEAEIIDFAATAGGHRTISVAPDGDIYVTDDSLVWRLPRS